MLSGVVFTQPWSTTLNDTYFDILFLVHVPRKLKEQFSNHHYGLKFLSDCEKKNIIPEGLYQKTNMELPINTLFLIQKVLSLAVA